MPNIVRYARVSTGAKEAWATIDGAEAVFLDEAPWNGGKPDGTRAPVASVKNSCARSSPPRSSGSGKELPGTRRRNGRRGPHGTARVREGALVAHCVPEGDAALAGREHARRVRRRARCRDRQALPTCPRGSRARLRIRLRATLRRHRSRSTSKRRPVDSSERLRHVLPASGPSRSFPESTRTTSASAPCG